MASAIVDCRPDQVPDLRRFWTRMYRADYILARDEAFLRWQFRGPSGAPDSVHVKLAIVDGEILGTLGYIPVDVSYRSRTLKGTWLANWIVDPERRRLGLGPLLMRAVASQFDITLNNGANQEARSVLPRMGWSDMGTLTRYVLVLVPDAAGSLLESGRLDVGKPPYRQPPSTDRVERVERFTTEIDTVWDRLTPALGAGTRRSAEYLNWRYAAHPSFSYRCFESRRDGRCTGAGVYRIETVRGRQVRFGRVVELFAGEGDAAALLDAIRADADSQDVAALDFFCTSPHVSRALSAVGFVHGEGTAAAHLPMLLQPLDYRRSAIHFMALAGAALDPPGSTPWYITRSDADQDRPN